MWEKNYRIADFDIAIKGANREGVHTFPTGFAPFERRKDESRQPIVILETGLPCLNSLSTVHYDFKFEELNLNCEFSAEKEFFQFRMIPNSHTSGLIPDANLFIKSNKTYPIILNMLRKGTNYTTNLSPSFDSLSEFSFLMWNAFCVATVPYNTLAIHSSVIIYKERAVLFLGESGTGKSTHTQLWIKTIKDCELLNDDSPIVRILEGIPVCYGSPWSGKGRCYRNESYPIGAIVRLKRSLRNHIRLLNKIEAFSALYPSCPPSFSIDSELTDQVCNTLSLLIEKVPVYQLDCRPDAEAAQLSCSTIFSHCDVNPVE